MDRSLMRSAEYYGAFWSFWRRDAEPGRPLEGVTGASPRRMEEAAGLPRDLSDRWDETMRKHLG